MRFASEDGEFAVCDLTLEGGGVVTIVGNILSAHPGETVEVAGRWQQDKRFGRQFAIEDIRSLAPRTREGVEKYLASGLIEGIGPVLARRIVAHFGEETLQTLDKAPGRIREVEGIGAVRAAKIQQAWREQRHAREAMVFLRSHGVSPAFAARVWKRYEERAIEVVSSNPYQLAEDIRGIGFRSADGIARRIGLARDSLERLRAGAIYCLKEAHAEGHIYLPMRELVGRAAELLEVPVDMLSPAVQSLAQDEEVVLEPAAPGSGAEALCYRARAWRAESGAARHLAALVSGGAQLDLGEVKGAVRGAFSAHELALDDAQRDAVRAVFEHPVVVITGGPGTGKTTIIRAVVAGAEQLARRVLLAAPTGRAAKRMSEACGRAASTIHRLLEFNPAEGGFSYHEQNPLSCDLVVIDEASMLDTYLFYALVRAIPPGASLLLVGDIDQLPSVGPGNILGDIIDSGVVKVMRLSRVFRQARESYIVKNAHRINHGQMPIAPAHDGERLADFYTIAAQTPAEAQEKILQLISERIPHAFGFDPLDEVQILSPMHRGEVGCDRLNAVLQARFNSGAEQLEHGKKRWKVGDKVMQVRNNYDLEVFNGDIGRLTHIDRLDERVAVNFGGRRVYYEFSALDELTLAWAITVHKSQGSEYPAVILPMLTQHYIMLQRNLLYTALTRAKKLAILVGSSKAVEIALKNARANQRYTRLAGRLRELSRA